MTKIIDKVKAYAHKPNGYFSAIRHDIVGLMPDNNNAVVLEIGCGVGATGLFAKTSGKAGRYIGIEIDPASAAEARSNLDLVFEADVERVDLESLGGPFDVVIISEVLEHLIEPWDVVTKVRDVMQPDGVIFASSPNIAHYRVLMALLFNRFDYEEMGVMDRTHLRWFTRRTFCQMFEAGGFVTEKVSSVAGRSWKVKFLNLLCANKLAHLLDRQTFYVGRKAPQNGT